MAQECRRLSNSSTSSMINEDPLLKDCISLRERLVETEKSLRNLTVTPLQPTAHSSHVEIEETEKSIISDRAPVLTLADLTPVSSENDILSLSRSHSQRMHSSLNDVYLYKQRKESMIGTSLSDGSNTDVSTLRKKLFSMREENSSLFIQNNKLMTELENTSYRLKQCQDDLHDMNQAVHENSQLKDSSLETIEKLERQIKTKNVIIKKLEKIVLELRDHLRQPDQRDEGKKRTECLKKIEDLEEKIGLKSEQEILLKNQIESLQRTNRELVENHHQEKHLLNEQVATTRNENLKLHEQIASIKNELLLSQQKTSQFETLIVENQNLKKIIDDQQAKLTEYDTEIIKNREHLTSLANFQYGLKVTEEESISSNNIDSRQVERTDVYNTSRSEIADLKLKLALRETEIHRLQTALSSTAHQQEKMKSDYNFEERSLRDLRCELNDVLQRAREGDAKQLQLEQSITRTQEELSSKTSQCIELKEQLSDQSTLINSLETKLSNRNQRLSEVQQQLEHNKEEFEKQEEQLRSSISSLSKKLTDTKRLFTDKERELNESQTLIESYTNQITHLENALLAHGEETKATDELVNKIKSLHSDHCQELEKQISRLQKSVEEKEELLTSLEKNLNQSLKESRSRETTVSEMKAYVNKMEELVEEKKTVIKTYEAKLQVVQTKADNESDNMQALQDSLNNCKNDLQKTLHDIERAKEEYSEKLNEKTATIQYLTEDLTIKTKRIEEVEQAYNRALEMLGQSQKRITELEDIQTKYEDEMIQVKHKQSLELHENKKEFEVLHVEVQRQKELVKNKEKQTISHRETIEKLHAQTAELKATLKDKECHFEQHANELKSCKDEVTRYQKLKEDLEQKLVEQISINQQIELEKNEVIKHHEKEIQKLEEECLSFKEELERTNSRIQNFENNTRSLELEKNSNVTAYKKLERMLYISNDNLSIKEKELSECHQKIDQIEKLLSQQKWNFKQKAAQYTKLEMSYTQEKSDLEKKVLGLKEELIELKETLDERNYELNKSKEKYEEKRSEFEEMSHICVEYEKRLKLQENTNLKTSSELKEVKESITRCRSQLRRQGELENEMLTLKNKFEDIQMEAQRLQSELISSQQTVLQLTTELDEVHTILVSKESDCTRLARELGASQVREAQEKARLNQELRKSLQEKEVKVSQKDEEIETIREKNDDLMTIRQQEEMRLRLTLQRKDNDYKVCSNDLQRSTQRVRELEDEVKHLNAQLKAEQQKSNELNEMMVLREAEAARYSARLSGYERGKLSDRTKTTGRSSDSNFALNDVAVPIFENNIFKTSENTRESSKERTFVDSFRGQSSHPEKTGSSLDALLKKTEEELRSLNLTNGLSTHAESFEVSLSDIDNLSLNSFTDL